MTDTERKHESGFSLIELMIAMVVTLIVSGAIITLMTSGGNTFKVEPERTDRQQNIRVAMSLIQRDIANAGMLLHPFQQALSVTDGNGVLMNGHGPAGTGLIPQADGSLPNAAGVCPPGKVPGDPVCSDWLEIFGNDGLCPELNACRGDTGASVSTAETLPPCYTWPSLVYVTGYDKCSTNPDCSVFQDPSKVCVNENDPTKAKFTVMWGEKPGPGANNSCTGTSSSPNGHMVFPPGAAPRFNPPGGPAFCIKKLSQIQVVTYQIRVTNGVPNLWRSPTGQATCTSETKCSSGSIDDPGQLVATGVEDMQVQYLDGSGTWSDSPKVLDVVVKNYADIVRQVRVTLSARALGGSRLQGVSTTPTGSTALRGQLTSVTSPRAALIALETGTGGPYWK